MSQYLKPMKKTKWLKINNNYYRKGLILQNNDCTFYEITDVLYQSGNFYFECEEYELMGFDQFLFSREIRKRIPIICRIIEEKKLHVKKTFTKQIVNNKYFLMADCLSIPF